MKECPLCNINPETNKTFIYKSNYWTILINYMQPTLGSMLLVSNRHIEKIPDLNVEESLNMIKQVKMLESTLTKTFKPDKVNYLMLANTIDHIHYHMVPRYEKPKKFAKKTWIDKNYGHTPTLSSDIKDEKTLNLIIKKLNTSLIKYK